MSSQEEFRAVVVIGAGSSGLYAAQKLKTRFPDVLILEATERIGGRIHEVGVFLMRRLCTFLDSRRLKTLSLNYVQVHGLAPWPIQVSKRAHMHNLVVQADNHPQNTTGWCRVCAWIKFGVRRLPQGSWLQGDT